MRKPCKSRVCDNESQKGPSAYCSNECKRDELKAVRQLRYAEEFGDLLTQDRFCICSDLLVQKSTESTRDFMNRGSCSRSCATKTARLATIEAKAASVDREIAASMKRLRDNSEAQASITPHKESLGDYWDKWSYKSKLIHNALTGSRLC